MYLVERNQVSQRSHVRVRQRCEVLRDLRFEFIQQRGELVVGVFEYVACITVDDGCTQLFHHFQCVLCKPYRRRHRPECRSHSNCNRNSERRVRSARLAVRRVAGIAYNHRVRADQLRDRRATSMR